MRAMLGDDVEDDNIDKKPTAVWKMLPCNMDVVPDLKGRNDNYDLSNDENDNADKKPAAVRKSQGRTNRMSVTCVSDSKGDGSPNPESLTLPDAKTGVNVEDNFASPPRTQKSGTSVVDIDPFLSVVKFKIGPRATSKSTFEISNIKNSCFY